MQRRRGLSLLSSVSPTAAAWLLTEGVLPAALLPSAHRKGGQKEPGWLLCGGTDRSLWSLPYAFLARKNIHLASAGDFTWTRGCSHGVQRTQVARPSCHPMLIQLNIPGSGDVIPKPHGAARSKGRAGSCGQRRAQGSPDVHHRGRWVSTRGDL